MLCVCVWLAEIHVHVLAEIHVLAVHVLAEIQWGNGEGGCESSDEDWS